MDEQPTPKAIESTDDVDTTDVIKQVGTIANSSADIVLKYILLAVLTLFGVMFFFQWRQNSSSPDKLITIMEQSVKANSDSLKVQEASLEKIQEFSIRVPMEHADMARKVESNAASLSEVRKEQADLRDAIISNSEAIRANTESVGRLVNAIEEKLDGILLKNPQPPPN
jgi:acyl carrier protein